MFIEILFNYRRERTHGECVIRANGPDTKKHGAHFIEDTGLYSANYEKYSFFFILKAFAERERERERERHFITHILVR